MVLREYEFTYICRADLPESEKAKLITKYEELLLKDGGQILKKDDWGVKKMNYPINKQFRGHYMHYDYVGVPDHLIEVERLMRIDEGVLRFMSINIGQGVDPEARKKEIAERAELIRKMNTRDNSFIN